MGRASFESLTRQGRMLKQFALDWLGDAEPVYEGSHCATIHLQPHGSEETDLLHQHGRNCHQRQSGDNEYSEHSEHCASANEAACASYGKALFPLLRQLRHLRFLRLRLVELEGERVVLQ